MFVFFEPPQFSTLNEIKLGQKTQEQVNIKLDKTLDAIQKEREIDEKNKKENDKNIRDMKMWVLGLVGKIFWYRRSKRCRKPRTNT
ncbi:hypothetical protein APW85_14145 [Staphylococcus aureus]|nr:hypothetical protein APW85_14145 [Staphylococcus aureus]